MFSCHCDSLKLCNFSLELSKMFYLQTVQTNILCVFSWKDLLKVILNLTCFMDLWLESYKYDKTKVRIIVINYRIVNQIFRIRQHCRMAMALQTYHGVLNWTSNENTYKARMPISRITFEWSLICLISWSCRMNLTNCFARTAISKSK